MFICACSSFPLTMQTVRSLVRGCAANYLSIHLVLSDFCGRSMFSDNPPAASKNQRCCNTVFDRRISVVTDNATTIHATAKERGKKRT